MKTYNISEAKAHFSELVKRALLGEGIVIARDNKPLLRLVSMAEGIKRRKPGSANGQILSIAPDFIGLPGDFQEYC